MESSTSNNPWPGRIIRVSTFVVLIVIFLTLGRFLTYHFMLSEGGVDCSRTTVTEQIIDTPETDLRYLWYDDGPDDPISWLLYDGRKVVDYRLEGTMGSDVVNGTVTWSKPDCGWLDEFNPSFGDVVWGHLMGLLAMAATGFALIVSMVIVVGLLQFGRFLWNGPTPHEPNEDEQPGVAADCSDPDCRCGYHRSSAVFDEEDKQWYGHCRDKSCECVEHDVDTFDDDKGEWV